MQHTVGSDPPLEWEIYEHTGGVGKRLGRVRWNGGSELVFDVEPQVALWLETCVRQLLAGERAAGHLVTGGELGGRLAALFTQGLFTASGGALRGVTVPRHERNLLPDDLTPAGLTRATTDGTLVWGVVSDGSRVAAGRLASGTPARVRLVREGEHLVLHVVRGPVAEEPIRQKDGWFRRCPLSRLAEVVTASPLSTAPDPETCGPPQWVESGAVPRLLCDPVACTAWRRHLRDGRTVERARFGGYEVVTVDTAACAPDLVQYHYRLFVLSSPGGVPVLAINYETGLAGPSFSVHRGGLHVVYGGAPAQLAYPSFRAQAIALLRAELLGAPQLFSAEAYEHHA